MKIWTKATQDDQNLLTLRITQFEPQITQITQITQIKPTSAPRLTRWVIQFESTPNEDGRNSA